MPALGGDRGRMGHEPDAPAAQDTAIKVPRSFVDLARGVAIHRDPARWSLLYEVLWRLTREGRDLMTQGDPTVERLVKTIKLCRVGGSARRG